MSTTHTPGPWMFGTEMVLLDEDGADFVVQPVEHNGYGIVAYVPGADDDQENRANARLIAAAPKMLAILQAILDNGSYDDDGDFYLAHRPGKRPEDDYLDAKPIADARALLARIRAARGGDHA